MPGLGCRDGRFPPSWPPSGGEIAILTGPWPPIPVRRPIVASGTRDWVPLPALLTRISLASAIPATVMVMGSGLMRPIYG